MKALLGTVMAAALLLAQDQSASAFDTYTPQAQVLMALGAVTVIARLCPQWTIDLPQLKAAMDRAGVGTDDATLHSSIVKTSMDRMTEVLTKEPTGETNPERGALVCQLLCAVGGTSKADMCQYLKHK